MDSEHCINVNSNIIQSNIIQRTTRRIRRCRNKTTSTRLLACCALTRDMLSILLKLYWIDAAPPPLTVSVFCS